MFRKMRRSAQTLSDEECADILAHEPRGVLAVAGEDGYPYALPMDFLYLGGKLYFHSARQGHKLDALKKDGRVSFCVTDSGFRKAGEWALNIRSVIIFGRARLITDPAETEHLALLLALKYYPSPEAARAEVVKAAARVQLIEVEIDHMSGKLVNES